MLRFRPKKITKTPQSIKTHQGVIDFLLVRSSAKRHLTICVDEKAMVSVRVPFHASGQVIDRFVIEKSQWIVDKLAEVQKARRTIEQRKFAPGQSFLFLGQSYPICVYEKEIAQGHIQFDGQNWKVSVPKDLSKDHQERLIKSRLINWYKNQAKEILGGRVFHFSRLTGLHPKTIGVRTHKRVWGNCHHSKQAIHLNWQMVLMPLAVIDYIVIHELCHLAVPNHSKRFWKKVESFMPDYKQYRLWLKKHQGDLALPL